MISEKSRILGIDVGGTKISIGIIVDGIVEQSVKLKTPAEGTQEEVIHQIIDGIESLPRYEEAIGIGVGAPGLIDEKQGIIFSVNNIPSWKEVHLKDYLSSHFKKPVYITNDANCFALGVKTFGAGQKYSNLVGLSLGTGVGAGIIANNSLYSGKYACAGEFGGLPYLDIDFETYCSGKFFKTFHDVKGEKVFKNALKGDEQSLEMFREFGTHVGNLIKHVLFVLAPEAIFIGGSVAKSFGLWGKSMWKVVDTFPYKKAIENLVIEKNTISKMPVIGAAALVQQRILEEEIYEIARNNDILK